MQKFDVQMALEATREYRGLWSKAMRQFQSDVEKVMTRLLHEAAANFMSVEEVARYSGLSPKRVRTMMREAGLNPRDGKTLLSKQAAEALASNAELLGVAPHEVDLMSPLAYLPAGSELRQKITDATVSRVTELPDSEGYKCNACRLNDTVHPAWVCTHCGSQEEGNLPELREVSGNAKYELPDFGPDGHLHKCSPSDCSEDCAAHLYAIVQDAGL